MLFDVGVELIFHSVLVFAAYLLLAGHNRPGGGFIAGLVAGAAFVVRYLTAGELHPLLIRVGPARLIGVGILVGTVVAVAPLMAGRPLLEATSTLVDLPVMAEVKLSSVLGFEVAVVLVVVGLVTAVLSALAPNGPHASGGSRRSR
jgi:multisubunit Na+/H+ antiporter MnhB subunit